MGIYRGPGGSGDATNDASSETRLAVEARDAAIAAQAAAEAAQAAAELAETNAETAETNAETAETNAETAATNAASSASSASTSATNAASSASSASTSATNAASSASSASSSASAASTSASNAATSATNASNSASTASTAATNASNSASAASTSATNASNSASAAATSATNAANSATAAQTAETNAELAETNAETAQAAAELAETNAETAATSASNSASAAATSATNASNSASAAATSATAAQTAETNAETAQAAAEAARDAALSAYDNFDDRYLGPKSSDPTLDNDGNALVAGALYFNTATNVMKVYDGSAWVAAYVSAAGVLLAANNLSDLTNTATARTNLGLGTAATTAATDYATAAQGAKADTALQPAAIGVSVQAYDADLAAFALKTAPTGAVVGTSDTQTLTNKTIALGSNTVSGTLAEFNTAVTDADFASIAGTETLTNKTLTSPVISGGSINGATVGASTPSTGAFTSLSDSGNLTFTGTGNRILGDFSNATVANQVLFQTSTTNGNTTIHAIPNGTGQVSAFTSINTSDTVNYSRISMSAQSADVRFVSSFAGTGTFLPMTFFTGGSERLRIDTSGNVGVGTSSPNGRVTIGANANDTALSGTSNTQGLHLYARQFGISQIDSLVSGGSNSGMSLRTYNNGTYTEFIANDQGNTTRFQTTGTERMRIDSSGNVGIGTSSPATKLNVVGGRSDFYANSNNFAIGVAYNNTSGNYYIGATTGATPALVFSDTTATERMRITSDGLLQFNSGYGSVATAYGCRAWVNFNGTGTVAIRGSGNVSSITDNGQGDYTVNFTTSMPDVNYAAVSQRGWDSTNNSTGLFVTSRATSNCRFRAGVTDGTWDTAEAQVAIFR